MWRTMWRWQSHITMTHYMFAITQIPTKNIRNWTSPFGNCGQFCADIRSHYNWHIPEPLAESSHHTFCNMIISLAEGFQLLNAHEKHPALFAQVLDHLWASRWLGGPSEVSACTRLWAALTRLFVLSMFWKYDIFLD